MAVELGSIAAVTNAGPVDAIDAVAVVDAVVIPHPEGHNLSSTQSLPFRTKCMDSNEIFVFFLYVLFSSNKWIYHATMYRHYVRAHTIYTRLKWMFFFVSLFSFAPMAAAISRKFTAFDLVTILIRLLYMYFFFVIWITSFLFVCSRGNDLTAISHRRIVSHFEELLILSRERNCPLLLLSSRFVFLFFFGMLQSTIVSICPFSKFKTLFFLLYLALLFQFISLFLVVVVVTLFTKIKLFSLIICKIIK